MIKKRIVITALVAMLAASMTVPAYAGAFDVVAGIRSGQYDNTETIDHEIVWYGSMNLLSKEDADDKLK